jgi:hypothetical protein
LDLKYISGWAVPVPEKHRPQLAYRLFYHGGTRTLLVRQRPGYQGQQDSQEHEQDLHNMQQGGMSGEVFPVGDGELSSESQEEEGGHWSSDGEFDDIATQGGFRSFSNCRGI